MNEKLIKRTIKPNKKFIYDMEDNTDLNFNEIEESMSGLGFSPTPNLGSINQAKINGLRAKDRLKKKSWKQKYKQLDECLTELRYLLK